jgi:hypothetical protein
MRTVAFGSTQATSGSTQATTLLRMGLASLACP